MYRDSQLGGFTLTGGRHGPQLQDGAMAGDTRQAILILLLGNDPTMATDCALVRFAGSIQSYVVAITRSFLKMELPFTISLLLSRQWDGTPTECVGGDIPSQNGNTSIPFFVCEINRKTC